MSSSLLFLRPRRCCFFFSSPSAKLWSTGPSTGRSAGITGDRRGGVSPPQGTPGTLLLTWLRDAPQCSWAPHPLGPMNEPSPPGPPWQRPIVPVIPTFSQAPLEPSPVSPSSGCPSPLNTSACAAGPFFTRVWDFRCRTMKPPMPMRRQRGR